MQKNGNGAEDRTVRSRDGDLPSDEALSALSDPYVRHTLRSLHGRRSAALDDLADVVTGMAAASAGTVATAAERDRTRLRLYHVVLPKLDALGYVAFDPDERTVTDVDVPPAALACLDVEE
jgi:hypothetical protein